MGATVITIGDLKSVDFLVVKNELGNVVAVVSPNNFQVGTRTVSANLHVSGVMTVGSGTVKITSNDIQFGSVARLELDADGDLRFFDTSNPSGGSLGAGWPSGAFGPGSDGAVDLDGTNTYASLFSKSGNTYTMIRSVWATNITVRAGVTLVKRYNLFANGTLTVEATGIIHDDGADASGGTQGAATGPGTRLPESTGTQGGAGRTSSTTGAAGSNNTTAYGGAGGAGGTGVAAGGAGGTITAPNAATDQIRDPYRFPGTGLLVNGTTWDRANGGAGGGSGGASLGTGTVTSGAGGGGAPVSFLAARFIDNSGTIRCNGGIGGNATVTGDAVGGGGGGGGGGYLILQSNTLQTNAGTLQVNGGAAGTGAGSGATAGATGSAGTIDYRGP